LIDIIYGEDKISTNFFFLEPGTKNSEAEIKLDENEEEEEEEEEVGDHREEVLTVIKSATEAIEASKALVDADDDDDDVLEIEDDQVLKSAKQFTML
jgi:hypothetical protein